VQTQPQKFGLIKILANSQKNWAQILSNNINENILSYGMYK